jgi:predicted O-methyltransferase YrrM
VNILSKTAQRFARYVVAWGCVVSAFTVGLANRSNREFLIEVCRRFGWGRLCPRQIKTTLPKIGIDRVINNQPILLEEPVASDGNVSLQELAVLNGVVLRQKPKAIFEIGSLDGRTTVNFARSSPADCVIYTLDLPPSQLGELTAPMNVYDRGLVERSVLGGRIASRRSANLPGPEKIRSLLGDSMKFDFSPYHGKIDLVFVDAAHTYEFVLSDSRNAFKLLRHGKGIILWHDYCDDLEVVTAIDQFRREQPALGPFFHIEGTTLAYLEVV